MGTTICVGQTYVELYLLYRENKMIAPLRERFDFILSHPSDAPGLDFAQPKEKSQELWSWCDALFMAPPVWVRLYAATDDPRYLDFAVTNWCARRIIFTTRTNTCFSATALIFKGVRPMERRFSGAAATAGSWPDSFECCNYLPMNHPDRPRFEQLFKDMAEKILTCQQPDGLWRASLLDPESYPLKETSGSGFYTYALAWGVNQGLLDRAKFEPAVRKAWTALVGAWSLTADSRTSSRWEATRNDLRTIPPHPTASAHFCSRVSEVYRMGGFGTCNQRSFYRLEWEAPILAFAVQNYKSRFVSP